MLRYSLAVGALAVLCAAQGARLHGEEPFLSFKQLSLYGSAGLSVPMEQLADTEPEDMLFAEHTADELSFLKSPGLARAAEESLLTATGGARLTLSVLEATGAVSVPQVKLGELGSRDASDIQYTYGAALSIGKPFPFSLSLMAGRLTRTGSVSRMKTPYFSAPSAFSQGTVTARGLSCSLPSFSSAAADDVMSLSLSGGKEAPPFVPSVSAYTTGGGEWGVSLSGGTKGGNRQQVAYSVSAAGLSYGRKGSSAWFKADKPFAERTYLSLSAEGSAAGISIADAVSLGTFAAVFAYENPFGGASLALRAQGSASLLFLGDARVAAGLSVCERGTVTASGSKITSPWQWYVNAQYALGTGAVLHKAGLTLYAEEGSVTLRTGYRLSHQSGTLSLSADSVLSDEGLRKLTGELSYTHLFRRCSSVTDASLSYTAAQEKLTGRIAQSLSFRKCALSSLGLSVTFGSDHGSARLSKIALEARLSSGSRSVPLTARISVSATF